MSNLHIIDYYLNQMRVWLYTVSFYKYYRNFEREMALLEGQQLWLDKNGFGKNAAPLPRLGPFGRF